MSILLCAATEGELRPFIEQLNNPSLQKVQLLITGVGIAATTYALTKAVSRQRPSMIIGAGIGGSFDPSLPLGSAVVIDSERFGDLGVNEQGFRSLFDMGLAHPDEHPFTGGRLVNKNPLLFDCGLPIVSGITVHQVSTAAESIDYYRQQLGAQVESMEGAALHYVALMEDVPFLQIRSISNIVGERDKKYWQMKASIASLNEAVARIIAMV